MIPSRPAPSAVSGGSQDFLHQAHRNNWQRYLAQLASVHRPATADLPSARPWDVCILTASDAAQAEMVTRQLALRGEAGLLPQGTRFLVVPDPDGLRIGSGGATLRVLTALYGTRTDLTVQADLAPLAELDAARQRILLIHSGGDSRRLPHCSATGKLFARIPRTLPDGRASTIFDEFLINLSGVAGELPPGILLVSGDVLLVFDHLQLRLHRRGVTGVSAAVTAEMGTRHGVYVNAPGSRSVRTFLHKAPLDVLASHDAVDADGLVQIDTGIVWLDATTAAYLAELSREPTVVALCGLTDDGATVRANTPLNLYGDLLMPLAQDAHMADYLADTSDGPATPGLIAARRVIWPHTRGLHFSVERLHPAVFVHFGTSDEYWRMVATDRELAATCAWMPHVAAWLDPVPPPGAVVAMNAVLGPLMPGKATAASMPATPSIITGAPLLLPLLLVDSHLEQGVGCPGPAIVAGVHTQQSLELRPGLVLHQLPVQHGYVTRLFGLHDDPKRVYTDAQATFLNLPWAGWLAAANLDPALIWPHVPVAQQTLWTARLFPRTDDREASLALTLALQDPAHAPSGWRAAWLEAPRLSLAESFSAADGWRLLAESAGLEDAIAAAQLFAAIDREEPAAQVAQQAAAWGVARRADRLERLAAWVDAADPVRQLRGYQTLAVLHDDRRLEQRAFDVLAHMIAADTRQRVQMRGTGGRAPGSPLAGAPGVQIASPSVRVEAAARIDFGGGWTDTPPYSIERGGRVFNAAVTLLGRRPIVAEATRLDTPRLVLYSGDIDESLEPATAGEVLAYANPADPFALLKASLVMLDVIPEDTSPDQPVAQLMRRLGHGLRLSTRTDIPRGSGLGTSSIMGGAVLVSLSELLGAPFDQSNLFDQVLTVEQMLTTGGGWQDQVGGLVGGIHLVTSQPGLPQRLSVEPVTPAPAVAAELAARLVLVYTGQQRLAKNLLRTVVRRWMSREPEMRRSLEAIALLADRMAAALRAGDLNTFGALLSEHWTYNQAMDPTCSNPFIDGLFRFMSPYIRGCKLAGAGGGGYAICIANGADAATELAAALQERYAATDVRVWPAAVAEQGLVIHRRT
jgi:fucokinase